jgi:hypothetical protein
MSHQRERGVQHRLVIKDFGPPPRRNPIVGENGTSIGSTRREGRPYFRSTSFDLRRRATQGQLSIQLAAVKCEAQELWA